MSTRPVVETREFAPRVRRDTRPVMPARHVLAPAALKARESLRALFELPGFIGPDTWMVGKYET